ncbi:MAG TPA: hypothetical protein DCY56_04150, partial [Candidatus Omnitrophica bacterium]|nr:hypothetical protein [Candidatus Omnitrophota bacterium]
MSGGTVLMVDSSLTVNGRFTNGNDFAKPVINGNYIPLNYPDADPVSLSSPLMIVKLQDFNKIVSDFIKMIEEAAEKDAMSKIEITDADDVYFLEAIKDQANQLERTEYENEWYRFMKYYTGEIKDLLESIHEGSLFSAEQKPILLQRVYILSDSLNWENMMLSGFHKNGLSYKRLETIFEKNYTKYALKKPDSHLKLYLPGEGSWIQGRGYSVTLERFYSSAGVFHRIKAKSKDPDTNKEYAIVIHLDSVSVSSENGLNEPLIKKIERQFEKLTPDEWEDFGKKVMAEVDELASSAIKVEETAIPAQEGAAASPLENKLNEGQIDLLETSLLPANKKLSQDAIDIINSFLACPPLYHVYLNRLEKEMRLFLNSSRDITTYADRYIKQEVEQGRNKITMYYCALSRDLLISALLLKAYRKADGGVLAIEDVKSKLHEDYHYEDSFYGLLPETGLKSIRKENKIPGDTLPAYAKAMADIILDKRMLERIYFLVDGNMESIIADPNPITVLRFQVERLIEIGAEEDESKLYAAHFAFEKAYILINAIKKEITEKDGNSWVYSWVYTDEVVSELASLIAEHLLEITDESEAVVKIVAVSVRARNVKTRATYDREINQDEAHSILKSAKDEYEKYLPTKNLPAIITEENKKSGSPLTLEEGKDAIKDIISGIESDNRYSIEYFSYNKRIADSKDFETLYNELEHLLQNEKNVGKDTKEELVRAQNSLKPGILEDAIKKQGITAVRIEVNLEAYSRVHDARGKYSDLSPSKYYYLTFMDGSIDKAEINILPIGNKINVASDGYMIVVKGLDEKDGGDVKISVFRNGEVKVEGMSGRIREFHISNLKPFAVKIRKGLKISSISSLNEKEDAGVSLAVAEVNSLSLLEDTKNKLTDLRAIINDLLEPVHNARDRKSNALDYEKLSSISGKISSLYAEIDQIKANPGYIVAVVEKIANTLSQLKLDNIINTYSSIKEMFNKKHDELMVIKKTLEANVKNDDRAVIFQRHLSGSGEVPALSKARPSVDIKVTGKTMADLYYGLAREGKPIGITPDVIMAQVKQLTREARKIIDLKLIVPRFRRILTALLSKDLGEDNRKIIQTALDLLNAHQLSEDELEEVNKGWLSVEKHQQFVQRQEEEATRILENSGLMRRLPAEDKKYYTHARSYHQEHALLAPFFRAFLVLSGIVYKKDDPGQIKQGLELYKAIKDSGELESFRFIEKYAAGIGKVEGVFPAMVIDQDIWDVQEVMKMIKTPSVGADRVYGLGKTAASERMGLRIFPRTVDVINIRIQEEMEKGNPASVDIPLEVLEQLSPEQVKGLGGSSAEVFLSALGVMLAETKNYSPEAREVIVANVLAGYADQNEEVLLFRELPMVTRGGFNGPTYNGIYILPLEKTYLELSNYIAAELAHFSELLSIAGIKQPKQLAELSWLKEVLLHFKEFSKGTNNEENMVRLDDETGSKIFRLIINKTMGNKLPVVGEIAYDTGIFTYVANGAPIGLGWNAVDGTRVYGALRPAYEFSTPVIVSNGDWRKMIEAQRVPHGRVFPNLSKLKEISPSAATAGETSASALEEKEIIDAKKAELEGIIESVFKKSKKIEGLQKA